MTCSTSRTSPPSGLPALGPLWLGPAVRGAGHRNGDAGANAASSALTTGAPRISPTDARIDSGTSSHGIRPGTSITTPSFQTVRREGRAVRLLAVSGFAHVAAGAVFAPRASADTFHLAQDGLCNHSDKAYTFVITSDAMACCRSSGYICLRADEGLC